MTRRSLMLAMGVAVAMPEPVAAAPIEDAVLRELNFARTQPQAYARTLRDYRKRFRGRLVHMPAEGVPLETVEGVRAVDEAIAFLERQPSLPPLTRSDVLGRAARDHARAQASGAVGHMSADGAPPGDRVRRRGGGPYVGETIAYGSVTGVAVVRQFIIDDGVADRGHRRLIFDGGFRHAGVGCGRHARFGAMCVVDYAETVDGRSARLR